RGGMLATGIVGVTAFWLIPKTRARYVAFAAAAAGAIYLAGPPGRERVFTSFFGGGMRGSSAPSRLHLWGDASDCIAKNPLFGVGPRNWPLVAEQQYGWLGAVKEAHNLWIQTMAQIGIPGFLFLAGFYGLTIWKLLPLARGKEPVYDPW